MHGKLPHSCIDLWLLSFLFFSGNCIFAAFEGSLSCWALLMLQIESVLHKILHELKVLYARHAPQLKPRKTSTGKSSSSSAASSATASSSSSSNSSSEQLSSEQLLLPDPGTGCNGGGVGGAALVASSSSSGAPCLAVAMSSSSSDDAIDPVTDMFNILEGSALIPFAEVVLPVAVVRICLCFV